MENEKAGGYVSVSYVGTKEDQEAAKPVEKKESEKKGSEKDEK